MDCFSRWSTGDSHTPRHTQTVYIISGVRVVVLTDYSSQGPLTQVNTSLVTYCFMTLL